MLPNVKYRIFLFSILISMKLIAQEHAPIEYVEYFNKHKAILSENFPHLFTEEEITNVEQLDSIHSKVSFTRGDTHFEAIVRRDLLLIATCEEISPDLLPANIKKNFHKKYGNTEIRKAFIVKTPYSSNFYRLDFYVNGQSNDQINSAFYNNGGQFVVPPY